MHLHSCIRGHSTYIGTGGNFTIREFVLFTLVHSISCNFLNQILTPRQKAQLGDQQMNFCMHSCNFARDSITTVKLHITCTVHPGLDIVGNKVKII